MVEVKAYAKVNLGLDVLRKREDGYHEVKMIMQSVNLFDILTFSVFNGMGVQDNIGTIRIESDSDEIPLNEGNLIYRACRLVMNHFKIKKNILVTVRKSIPVAAGLAGGSADCAAALKGMNELFRLGMSLEEMQKIGVRLGADVPYCLLGGTALAEGIGEILTPLPNLPNCIFLIAKPPFGVSTKEVYTQLSLEDKTIKDHPDIDGIRKGIEKQDMKIVTAKMGNMLEQVTIPMHPEIKQMKDLMLENGALNALMSGSGPTVFGIFDHLEQAWNAHKAISDAGFAQDIFIVSGQEGEE